MAIIPTQESRVQGGSFASLPSGNTGDQFAKVSNIIQRNYTETAGQVARIAPVIAKAYIDRENKINDAFANELHLGLHNSLSDITAEYRGLPDSSAASNKLFDEYVKKGTSEATKHGELAENETQKSIYYKRANATLKTFKNQLTTQSIQAVNRFSKNNNANLVELYIKDAISSGAVTEATEEQAKEDQEKYTKAVLVLNKRLAEDGGLPTSGVLFKQTENAIRNRIATSTATELIENGNIERGEKYIKNALKNKTITPEQSTRMLSKIGTMGQTIKGKSAAIEAYNKATENLDLIGVNGTAQRSNTQEILAHIRKTFNKPEDEVAKKASIDQLGALTINERAIQDSAYKSLLKSAVDTVLHTEGGHFSKLPETILSRLKPKDQQRLRQGRGRPTSQEVLEKLMSDSQELKKVEDYELYLSPEDYDKTKGLKAKLEKNPTYEATILSAKDLVISLAIDTKIITDKKEKNNFYQSVLEEIDTEMAVKKRQLSTEEKKQVIQKMLANKVMVKGWFGRSSEKISSLTDRSDSDLFVVYEGANPSGKYKNGDRIYLKNISEQETNEIKETFRALGRRNPTVKEIGNFWARKQADSKNGN